MLGVVCDGIELDILSELVSLVVGIELDNDDEDDVVTNELELELDELVLGVVVSSGTCVDEVVGVVVVVGIDDDTVDGVDSLDVIEDVSLVD